MVNKRVLYLYLKTGNGHLSSANALSHAVSEKYGQIENLVADALPPDTGWFRSLLEEGYRSSVHELSWTWPVAYELGKLSVFRHLGLALLRPFVLEHLRTLISTGNFTTIVSLHFLLSPLVHEVLTELGLSTRTVTVVTDPFTPHPFWFMQPEQNLVVFSESAKARALKSRVPAENLTVVPIMTKRKYEVRLTPEEVQELKPRLGLPLHRPVVLIAGGGDGLPHAEKILKGALGLPGDIEFVVVCGQNRALAGRCAKVAAQSHAEARVRIHGLVDNMYELMSAADVVITKGGPATVMEALLLEKPLLLSHYIYGQEQGNVDYVTKNQVGYYVPQQRALLRKLHEMLNDPALAKALISAIRQLNLVNGTDQLARFVAEG